MKKNKLIIVSILVAFGLLTCIVSLFWRPNSGYIPTSPKDTQKEQSFISLIGNNVVLNSGIELVPQMSTSNLANSNQASEDFAYIVLNHTDENVLFSNQGYDVTVLSYDSVSKKWLRYELQDQPGLVLTILPPKLENFDYSVSNDWLISSNNFDGITTGSVRIYVSGIGSDTNSYYGSYVDFDLRP